MIYVKPGYIFISARVSVSAFIHKYFLMLVTSWKTRWNPTATSVLETVSPQGRANAWEHTIGKIGNANKEILSFCYTADKQRTSWSRAGKAVPFPTTKSMPLLSSEAFCICKLCVYMQINLLEPKAVGLEIIRTHFLYSWITLVRPLGALETTLWEWMQPGKTVNDIFIFLNTEQK